MERKVPKVDMRNLNQGTGVANEEVEEKHFVTDQSNPPGEDITLARYIKWTIKGYSAINKGTDEGLESPWFSVGPNDETIWFSRFTPGGRIGNPACYVSLHMISCNLPGQTAFGKFRFRCRDMLGHDIVKGFESDYRKFSPASELSIALGYGGTTFHEGVCRRPISLILDRLDIFWDIILLKHDAIEQITRVVKTQETLSKELEELFHSHQFADVRLVVEKQEILAHRAILSARSSVFDELIRKTQVQGDVENPIPLNVSRLEIDDDVDFEVLKALIYFIYTGETPNIDQMAKELFVAADKYELQDLKERCEDALCIGSHLTIASAAELMGIAFEHNGGRKLKSHILRFIKNNIRKVQMTDGWRKLLKNFPFLASEIVAFSFEM